MLHIKNNVNKLYYSCIQYSIVLKTVMYCPIFSISVYCDIFMYHNTYHMAGLCPKHNPGHVSLSHSQAFVICFGNLSKKNTILLIIWEPEHDSLSRNFSFYHSADSSLLLFSSITPVFISLSVVFRELGLVGLLFFKVLLGERKKRWEDPNTWSREAPEMVACLMLKYNSIHINKSVSTNILFKEAWIFKNLINLPAPPAEFCRSKLL